MGQASVGQREHPSRPHHGCRTVASSTDARELKTPLAIIGTMAYKFHFPEIERYTADIDLTVALDLDDSAELEMRLSKLGWNRDAKREPRWTSPRATLIDLLPAGAKLRAAKKLIWPERQLSMSLVGVFRYSERNLKGSVATNLSDTSPA